MHAVNRFFYVLVIILAVLSVIGILYAEVGPSSAFIVLVLYSGVLGLTFFVGIASLVIGRGTLRAIHQVLPIYYIVKAPIMAVLAFVTILFAIRGDMQIHDTMIVIGAFLHLVVFAEALWAAVMLVISWKEK